MPRSPLARRRFLLALPLLALLGTGCSTARKVSADDAPWPTECAERHLYRGSETLVYATGRAEAKSVAALVARVDRDYRELTGRAARTLVPVAIGSKETLPIPASVTFPDWIAEHAWLPEEERRGFVVNTPEFDEEMGEVSSEFLALLAPILFDITAIDAGFPAAEPPLPAVFLPTSAARRWVIDEMVDRGLEKEEVAGWKRLLLSPVLAVVVNVLEGKLEDLSTYALMQWQLRIAEPPWTEEERDAFMTEYAEKLEIADPPDFGEAREEMGGEGSEGEAPE